MSAMNNGVAHYSIPGANALPGQIGNVVITGHSAGDIYSNNQYKFIFSGLERLENGDLIYINYESVRYTYSVVKKETVDPSDVDAVTPETDKPQLILVTCTPLGTSKYRLLVTAEQINPSYEDSSSQEPKIEIETESVDLPSNEPSFFERIWNWLTGQSDN
jgi:LPXTG-site transpeptidase (sortase) family protein